MYLEISARRSGKTQRLIDAAIRSLDKGKDVVIVTPLHGMLPYISDDLRQALTIESIEQGKWFNKRVAFFPLSLINTSKFKKEDYKKYIECDWFFDEPFFAKEQYKVPIHKNGYYVGTPSELITEDIYQKWKAGIVDNTLLNLLEANNWKYEAHTWIDKHNLWENKKDLSPEIWKIEMLGEFVD